MSRGSRYGWIDPAQPVNRLHPLNRGLVGWWLASDQGPCGFGTNQWFDISGRKNHGALTGDISWQLDGPNRSGSLIFNTTSTSNYLGLGSGSIIGVTTEATWGIWHRGPVVGASSPDAYAWTMDPTGSDTWCQIISAGTNLATVRFGLRNSAGSRTFFDTAATMNTLQWNHIVCRWRAGTMNIFLNGVKDANSGARSGTLDESTSEKRIGGGAASTESLHAFADPMWWQRGLFDAEVAALYHESLAGYPNLLRRLDWPLFAPVAAGGGGTILPGSLGLMGVGV